MNNFTEVIARLGHGTALSPRWGVPKSTINAWAARNSIPPYMWRAVLDELRRQRVPGRRRLNCATFAQWAEQQHARRRAA